jgi:hypothetical protein
MIFENFIRETIPQRLARNQVTLQGNDDAFDLDEHENFSPEEENLILLKYNDLSARLA